MALKNLIGEVLDGKYHIEKQLGEGGMGAVYFATHLGTERPVALKVIAPQFMQHDEFVERFRREARAAGRLRHPNVVDVTDFGFARVGADQVAYLVMEYLDGCTLDEILEEETSLPLSWVIDILEQTCSAVDEAHQQGIIHRDLKPDNIWLEPNRRGGYTIKVLDFGIAKLDEIAEPVSTNSAEEYLPPRTPIFDSLAPTESGESPTLITGGGSAPPAALEQSEAATQIQPPAAQTDADLSEAGTLALTPEADESEAGTRMLPAQSMEEMGTRILEQRTTDKRIAMQTGSASSLTRVGSILGTPLYMSPEQCRGERLDARTDIYSLGVIAYRLLSGETPFSGDLHTVMKMHRDEPPPPLAVKRVPKKVKALVMSALSKNPDERPPSAAAFANAFRAHSSSTGTLLRHALTLYSEHMPTFLRLMLIVYAPVVVTTLLHSTLNILAARGKIPSTLGNVLSPIAALLNLLVSLVSASVVVGITTWLVTQVLALPLRPLLLRPAFSAMKKRFKPLIKTTLLTNFLVLLGMALCVIPGMYLMMRFALVAPAVMMEDLRGRAARKRSYALYHRSRRTVVAIIFIHMGIPLLVGMLSSVTIILIVKALKVGDREQVITLATSVQQIVFLPFNILLSSIASVVTGLLYWKTRLAGGETLREALVQFADEEVSATSRWQQRMRTRLQTHMKTHR
jgi:serine/threonine protein kinase